MMSARVRIVQGTTPMVLRQIAISAGALVVAIAFQGNPANALSMQECSAKYNAAKEAGTLGGMKWNVSARRSAERMQQPHRRLRQHPRLQLRSRRKRQRPSLLPRPHQLQPATRYFPTRYRPSTRASPPERQECKRVWTNTVPTK
jgi:hypothetical protein